MRYTLRPEVENVGTILSLEPVGMEPFCSVHTETKLICPRCIAAKGGRSRSKAKLAAVRKNAKLGGRPKRKLARHKNLPVK